MKNNGKYWKERFTILEESQLQKGVDYYKELENQYQLAASHIEKDISAWYQRFAKNNNITMTEAKKLLDSGQLKELHWSVEEYIKYGKENALNGKWIKELENASSKVHISRLEALELQLKQHMETLYNKQLNGFQKTLKDIYQDGYYKGIYEIQKGLGIGHTITGMDTNQLDKVLSKPWTLDNRTFSDRIWKNKEELIQEVHTQLTQMLIRGDSPEKAIQAIAKKFHVSQAQAGRLIMTESAFFASLSKKEAFEQLGVEQFEVVSALDSTTCNDCGDLDGKPILLKDFEIGVTAPPFHPNCRCTTCPHFDEKFEAGKRIARNEEGKQYEVPSDMNYNEWKEKFVENKNKNDIIEEKANSKTSQQLEQDYHYIDEQTHEDLMEEHRKTITDEERLQVNGFDWDNYRDANIKYGYINTKNAKKINGAIREGTIHTLEEQFQNTITALQSMISRNKIQENILANRFLDENWIHSQLGATKENVIERINYFIENNILITDNQFVSCSLTEQAAYDDRNFKLILRIPKGTNAHVTENRWESEIILYKPTYRLISVEETTGVKGNPQLAIICEIEKGR